MDMNLSELWELVKDRETWSAGVCGIAKSWTLLSDRTAITTMNNMELDSETIIL